MRGPRVSLPSGLPDFALIEAKIKAGLRGRAYWQVRYRDSDRIVSEWDGVDWKDIPRAGLIEVRLICPNGQHAILGNTVDASDRLFQFKVAVMLAGVGRAVTAQVIGMLNGNDGQCQCVCWVPEPGELIQFQDNVFGFQHPVLRGIANMSWDVLGVMPG